MSHQDRYFVNAENLLSAVNTRTELLAALERIVTHNPPDRTSSVQWSFHGLYTGPTSIAYLFYRLHSTYSDLMLKNHSLLEWSQAYLDLSEPVDRPGPDPNHCGIANEALAYWATKAVVLKNPGLIGRFCSYRMVINSNQQSGSNEWLYGRAGYLYFLRLIRAEFEAQQDIQVSELLNEAIHETVERILAEPQPWVWHGTQYLGAAHGVIGIICQVVLAEPSAAPRLQYLLSHLLKQQYASGNFPSSLPPRTDKLVQFCHGGPGFILSLESILPHFPTLETEIKNAIHLAREDVGVRGLLTKAPSLCHGIAGNALALETYEQMAQFLAHMRTSALEEHGWIADAGRSDKFTSLYTGEAGRAWAWAVLDSRLPRICIGYNDL